VLEPQGGDAAALLAKLIAARVRWAKVSGSPPSIVLCYGVGYDAFSLARFLKARDIEWLVIDPGSLEVKRRSRRVKRLQMLILPTSGPCALPSSCATRSLNRCLPVLCVSAQSPSPGRLRPAPRRAQPNR
jgi:hypothetical protein